MRNSPGLAGVAYKFTVKMKARRILHEKTQRFLRGRQEWHLNLQSKWRPRAFYMRKHNDFSAVGARAHFTWENTTISPRSVRARILHEKTQRFLRGRCAPEEGVYFNNMRKHNDFSAFGAHLRKGCILIRNRDWSHCVRLHTCWMLRNWVEGG